MNETLRQIIADMRQAAAQGDHGLQYSAGPILLRTWADRIERLSASEATGGEVKPMKLLGYANASRIRMTCASKPGGAHLGQVAIYAGESVDPMESQGLENLMWKEDRL